MEAPQEVESAFNFRYIKSSPFNSQGLAPGENRWQTEMFVNIRNRRGEPIRFLCDGDG
jgi:hypothetical protein